MLFWSWIVERPAHYKLKFYQENKSSGFSLARRSVAVVLILCENQATTRAPDNNTVDLKQSVQPLGDVKVVETPCIVGENKHAASAAFTDPVDPLNHQPSSPKSFPLTGYATQGRVDSSWWV
ncbi:unnamed protein product [Phytophthora fragariaefolia]|uniref:Unnamed protein product n=1 Tax=Phytophthora fragariaefolia TaxID=1490495 RepID=A0A9W6Y352_9STRA|nr:unnamed protein product [Phytophthora fragariaefolia]